MADVVLQQILHTAGKEPLSTTNGALHTQVKGTDGLAPKTLKTDTDGKLIVSHDSGLATEATLAAINTALALVKAELEELKANQLSGEQKVQLTGNIVAEAVQVANNVEVAAGATVMLGPDHIDLRAYREITAYATTTADHSWELRVVYRLGASAGAYSTNERDGMATTGLGAWISWTVCKTTSGRVVIQNNDTVPHTYRAWYHVR